MGLFLLGAGACSSTPEESNPNTGQTGPGTPALPHASGAPIAAQPRAAAAPQGVATTGVVTPPGGAVPGALPNGGLPTAGSATNPDQSAAPTAEGGENGPCTTAGIELEGLMYSPGGELLPFPCEPFNPTTNNPYAVRCVDAWPWFKTQFPGDEYCILPPEPGKGIQIGVHPQGAAWYEQVSQGDLSGYDDIHADYLLNPGEEEERNYVTGSPNTDAIQFYRSYVRMRPGSHHMIVSSAAASGQPRDAWKGGNAIEGIFGGTSLPGAQRPDENVPKTLNKPEEDKGLYTQMGANQDVVFNMHHFNSIEQVTLKEAWENLWFSEDASVRVIPIFGLNFAQVGGTFAQPGEENDIHYRFDIGSDTRVIQLFGHRHVWTTNFTAWVDHADGSQDILYQSFDWFDQPTYRYDNSVQNPTPASEMLIDGGASGVQTLSRGDVLHFNCHINYTNERAAAEEAPTPDSIGRLRFANQAFEGEMCILFGSTSGASLGTPAADSTPVPDFASID